MPWGGNGGSVELEDAIWLEQVLDGGIIFTATRDGEEVDCIVNEEGEQSQEPYYELVYQDTLQNFATVTFNNNELISTFNITNVRSGVSITSVRLRE